LSTDLNSVGSGHPLSATVFGMPKKKSQSRAAARRARRDPVVAKRPRLRLQEPGDLIDALPYLIGFQPKESLVLVGFARMPGGSGRKQTEVCMRIDLPRFDDVLVPWEEYTAPLAQGLARSRVEEAALVIVTDDPGDAVSDNRWITLGEELTEALARRSIRVMDLLLASPDRWWSLQCGDESCCPPSGVARGMGTSLAVTEATVAGLTVLPDRDAVARVITPLPDDERAKAEPDLEDAEHRVREARLGDSMPRVRETDLQALLVEIERRGALGDLQRSLTPKRLARFAVALTDISIRDALWMAIDDRSVDAEDLMREMAVRLPSPYDAPPLFLYAWAQWRRGNGVLASIAAERALRSNPGYSAAGLLFHAVQSGLNPHTTPLMGEPLEGTA